MGNATVPAEGSRGPPSQIKLRTTITQVTESAAVEASLTLPGFALQFFTEVWITQARKTIAWERGVFQLLGTWGKLELTSDSSVICERFGTRVPRRVF